MFLFFLITAHPYPPGVPTVAKTGKTYAELEWEKPARDGGAKIKGTVNSLLFLILLYQISRLIP